MGKSGWNELSLSDPTVATLSLLCVLYMRKVACTPVLVLRIILIKDYSGEDGGCRLYQQTPV